VKYIIIAAIGFLLSGQLFAQFTETEPLPFEKLIESEQELRRKGAIKVYHYQGERFTGVAIEKKLTSYFLYRIKNGNKHGKSTQYSLTDKAKKEWEYHKGMLRYSREWYADGDLKSEVEFNRKSRLREYKEWYRNGQLKQVNKHSQFASSYKVKRYSNKGEISEKGKEIYVESGKKMVRKKTGKWSYYNRHGKRKKIETYDQNGQLISSKKR
jgi:antitoxin component YwqK of YwqJK toxin-antitoxin module